MFNLGMGEILVLGVIALIVVGPEKLPGLARNVGRFINDIKRTTSDVTREISKSIDEQNFNLSNKQNLDTKNETHEGSLGSDSREEGFHDDYAHEDFHHDHDEFDDESHHNDESLENDQQLNLIDDQKQKHED